MMQCILCGTRNTRPATCDEEFRFCSYCERQTVMRRVKPKDIPNPKPQPIRDNRPQLLKPVEMRTMSAKSNEDIRTREQQPDGTVVLRKTQAGDEFVIENPHREQCQFDFNQPDAYSAVSGYIDWLQEQGCSKEAELMMLDWSIKIGQLAPGKEALARIQELRKEFKVPDKKLIHEKVMGQRGREQTITLYLQEPLGVGYFMKATVNQLHMENAKFQAVIRENPITYLLLACNATQSPALTAKLLTWGMFSKIESLELNNLEISFVQLREMFKGSRVKPRHLKISGRTPTKLTADQIALLPELCQELKDIWTIEYHGLKYDYRFPVNEQPK